MLCIDNYPTRKKLSFKLKIQFCMFLYLNVHNSLIHFNEFSGFLSNRLNKSGIIEALDYVKL